MSSAFLKGMLHGQAGCRNPLWENEQSWTSSTKVLWEGVRGEQERWAMLPWTLTLFL